MIRPPPASFATAAPPPRARLADRQPSALLRALAWLAAGSFTLGLHIGLYLLLTRHEVPAAAPVLEPAAVMVNLAPEAVVAKSEVDNDLATPEAAPMEEAAAMVEEAPPPPAPEPVVDTPPPPPNVKPQAVLPAKPPEQEVKRIEKTVEKKPVEKEKPKKPVEKKKDKPTVAVRAGGGPRSDRRTADVTAAAAAGSAVSQASLASWQNEMRARIVRAKRFPPEARGQSYGVALVSVSFGANGSVSGARLIASSGNAALDAEAVAVMYRAAPYPPPPGGKAVTQTIPLNFNRR